MFFRRTSVQFSEVIASSLSPVTSSPSPLSAIVLTLVPNGGALATAFKVLGYSPYLLEDTFTKGRALTHPQEWLGILEGQKEFSTYFLNRSPREKAALAPYNCLVGPPATLAFESILEKCPRSTKVILVEEPDKELWARDTQIVLSTISNYKNHSGPGVILYNMINVMMDFYRCVTARRRVGKVSLYRYRSLADTPSVERLAGSLELFEEHVKATVPADRLLVYRIGEGWEPLCAFLGVEVPRTGPDGSPALDFPVQDNGLDAFVKIRDALSISRKIVGVGVLLLLSAIFAISSYAISEFRQELQLFYQYTKSKFMPYIESETRRGEKGESVSVTADDISPAPAALGFRKSMVLAKRSALEYGEKFTKSENVRLTGASLVSNSSKEK